MEKGAPPPAEGDGADAAPPRPALRERARRSESMPLPAIVAIVLVVLAGTSGTVLLARDAGGTDASTPALPAARVQASPSVPPTAPAVTVTLAPAPAASAAPSPSAAGSLRTSPVPSPRVAVSPAPVYAGPSPVAILGGSGPAPQPQASRVTPDQLSWRVLQEQQQSRPQSVVIVNTGGEPLHVFPAGIVGDDAGDFSIQGDSCSGATIQPQEECSIAIVFLARQPQASAELRVSDDTGGSATGTPTKTSTVPLSGTAG